MDKQVSDLIMLEHKLIQKAPEYKDEIHELVNDYFQILMIVKYGYVKGIESEGLNEND